MALIVVETRLNGQNRYEGTAFDVPANDEVEFEFLLRGHQSQENPTFMIDIQPQDNAGGSAAYPTDLEIYQKTAASSNYSRIGYFSEAGAVDEFLTVHPSDKVPTILYPNAALINSLVAVSNSRWNFSI